MLRGTSSGDGTPSSSSTRDESDVEDPEEPPLEHDVKVEVKEEFSETDEETNAENQYFEILEETKGSIDDDGGDIHVDVDKDQKPDLRSICLEDREQGFGSMPSPNSNGRRSARLKRQTDDFGFFGQVPQPPPVKRKAKPDERPVSSSSAIPKQYPIQLHCLLCFKTTDENALKLMPSITEMDFQVMFILKKMLNIPSVSLADYLERFGHPREWITFCSVCIPKVNKAIVIQKEINRLEENLRTCQKELVNTIKKSWSNDQEIATVPSSNHVIRVTVETRKHVLTGKCLLGISEGKKSSNRKRKKRG